MKKNAVALVWVAASVVVFLLSFFLTKRMVARKDPVEETEALEKFSENEELSYIKWAYDGWQSDWEDDHNLTSTSICTTSHMYAEGIMLMDSWEEYQALLSATQKKEQDADETAHGTYTAHEVRVDGLSEELDASFFSEYQLAVVDFCRKGNPHLRSRLESVQTEGTTVTVTFSRELYSDDTEWYMGGYVASQFGHVYWIPVPRECTDVVAEFHETEWARP